MRFNEYGEYRPYLVGNCTDCGLCSGVCPFVRGNSNEDEIGGESFGCVPGARYTPETGYYLDSHVGYAADPEVRWRGASGGMATSLLCELLEKNIVDYVLAVSPNSDPNLLFKYVILGSAGDVKKCSKSAYYPVELSEVLRHVKEVDARYALVGLPCFIKAVRLAQNMFPVFKRRIVCHVGLVCGQLKSKHYAQYLSQRAGMTGRLRRVDFRRKVIEERADNFRFVASNETSEEFHLAWNHGVADVWLNEWFTLMACHYCDDVFAECSDVAFMDAWLPSYAIDPRGHSIVLARVSYL